MIGRTVKTNLFVNIYKLQTESSIVIGTLMKRRSTF